jgi:hypothetical protein
MKLNAIAMTTAALKTFLAVAMPGAFGMAFFIMAAFLLRLIETGVPLRAAGRAL